MMARWSYVVAYAIAVHFLNVALSFRVGSVSQGNHGRNLIGRHLETTTSSSNRAPLQSPLLTRRGATAISMSAGPELEAEEEMWMQESVEPVNRYRKVKDVNAKFYRVATALTASVGLACVLVSILGLGSGGTGFAVDMDVTGSAMSKADLKSMFDPAQFSPVCPSSDSVYNILKGSANVIVGPENVMEYGPLIASVLLRIRLELCVLESFVYEAIVPFIRQKGISWILPLHETVETFVAGTIFAVASNFILLGSTKILTVLFVYFDALTGFPARNIGKLIKRASPEKSPGQGVGGVLQGYGEVSGFVRRFLEGADTFVGRYLVIATTAYIAFKFAHFKLFNDIF